MNEIIRIGMDTSKHLFELHGVNAAEEVALKRRLRRSQLEGFFTALAPTVVVIEACAGSHHLARRLESWGHAAKLIAPQHAKPYRGRAKNDAADAKGLCAAGGRPEMRFVPVKSPEAQAGLMLMSVRDQLIRERTKLANAIRGHAAEFGLIAPKGLAHVEPLLARALADPEVPALARRLFALMAERYAALGAQTGEAEAELAAFTRASEVCRRLQALPGVGPVGAALLMIKTPDPGAFGSGRAFAAWLGLTPKDHSSGGKVRLGAITRAGDEALRAVLVVGATSVIASMRRAGKASPKISPKTSSWLARMLERKPPKLVAVALANKTARIAWKLMAAGERYDPARGRPAAAG